MSSQMVIRHADPADVGHERPGAGCEVAALVEDAVVRQLGLAGDSRYRAVAQQRGRVVDASRGSLGEADDRVDAGTAARRLFKRGPALAHEEGVEQEILRRVAREGQLGEDDQVRAGFARPAGEGDDPLEILAQVPDRGVDLRQCDFSALHEESPVWGFQYATGAG